MRQPQRQRQHRTPLRGWADAWLPTTSHLAPATRRSYADLLRLHVIPTLGHRALTDIKPSQLSALYAQLATTRARATVVKTHAAVLQLCKAATEDGLIPANPATAAKLPKRTLQDSGRQRARNTGPGTPRPTASSWPVSRSPPTRCCRCSPLRSPRVPVVASCWR